MASHTQLVAGLAGAIGSRFRSTQNQLVFVEYGGKLSRLNLFAPGVVVSKGSTVLKGTWTFDLDNGVQGGVGTGFDLWWEQMTAVARQMVAQNGARIVNLGAVSFTAINANHLQALVYGTAPIPGSNDASNKLVTGDVFAVRTNQGNFAKVKVVSYGYDLSIQWVTYRLGSAYGVLGSGYANPEDVDLSADGLHAYVTERSGNLVRVALASANRAAATLITAGMNAPQQIALDEAHQAAYVIEYATPGHLWRIDLATGSKTAALSNINNGVGLVLSADRQFAYISEQTGGADAGRVSRIQLSNGQRSVLAMGLTNPFFLTWADAAQTALLVPERDPANRITRVPLDGTAPTLVVAGVPARPSSVALITAGRMLVCSDQVIERVDISADMGMLPSGPLLMGIGFVPFDKVLPSGLATTDPGYFYAVSNAPFGGRLPLMLNHQRAANDGAKFYRVLVDGVTRTDAWSDYKWSGTQYVLQTIAPVKVGSKPNCYPVHPISELFLWMNPSLGMLTDSTVLTDGLHTIELEFLSSSGVLMASSTPLTIMVNNQRCVATLAAPLLIGASADSVCGVLRYGSNTAATVTLGYAASQPSGYATYAFSVIKGISGVLSTSGGVPTPLGAALTPTVQALLGTCVVAGFAEYLYVAATIQNGWSRQSQYDASAAFAFVLAP